jgi:hypothetical protein
MLALIALAAATLPPAQIEAVRVLAAQDVRVATIARRLARGGTGEGADRLCIGQVSQPGLVVQDITQYPASQRATARAALGLGDGPTVIGVVPESSAMIAGVKAGDVVLAVDHRTVDASVAKDPYARVQQVEDLIEAGQAKGRAQLTVGRGGDAIRLDYRAEAGCASRVQIVPGRSLNAKADGRYVQVTGGMIDFARGDDELATLIAHEMAHNILEHRRKKTPSKQAEYEADRLGVWLVARAGYDVGAVVPFWTRLGRKTGLGILSDGTHPRWKPRVAAVASAVAEVAAQRASGQVLVPQEQQSSSQAKFPR